jgi:hypothetical protein
MSRNAQHAAHAQPASPQERPLHIQLGARLVGVGALLALSVGLSAVTLSGMTVMWAPLVLCGFFVLAFLGNGIRIWSGRLPAARLVSFLSGSSVFIVLVAAGMLLFQLGFHQGWQSVAAVDFVTVVLPLFIGVPLAMVISGWAGQPVRPGRRLYRSVRLYSGIAGLSSVLLLGHLFFLSSGNAGLGLAALLVSLAVHLLCFFLVPRLLGRLDAFDEQEILDSW